MSEKTLLQFEECEKKLLTFLGDEDTVAAKDLHSVLHLVQELEGCVRNLCTVSPSPSPAVLLTVVKKVLELCQHEAKRNFSETLNLQLGNLFKATYSLLKLCLDNISTEQLNSLLLEVASVASVSLHFDPSLLVLCWRSVGKLACGSDAARLDVDLLHIVEQLCVAIEVTTQQSVVKGDPLLDKRLKSGRFLGSLLLRVLEQHPAITHDCCQDVLRMLLCIHQAIYGVSSSELRSKLESNFLCLREPLTGCVSKSQGFLQLLLNVSSVSSGQFCGWGLCISSLMKHFPSLPGDIQRYCLDSTSSREEIMSSCRLLDSVFICLEHCHWELLTHFPVSGVVCAGKGPVQSSSVSVYEVMCCHLNAFLASLSNELLHCVEMNLVAHLLAPQPFSAQLASDCLFFIARLGGDDVAVTYCQLVMDLLLPLLPAVPSHSSPVILLGSLLNRLVGLLSSPAQLSLLSLHLHHSCLWAVVKSRALHRETVSALHLQLASDATNTLMAASSPSLDQVGPSLYCLSVVLHYQTEVGSLPDTVIRLLQCPFPYGCELCIYFISLLLPVITSETFAKILKVLSQLTSQQQPFSLTLATCHLLGKFASLHLQEWALNSLCNCFFSLLSCGHWLVRHHTLEALRAFAELTPHESAVELCIPPFLTDAVIGFLHKIPCRHELCKAKWLEGVMLYSGPDLLTVKRNDRVTVAVRELKLAWERVQALQEEFSIELSSQLGSIRSNISSFLHH